MDKSSYKFRLDNGTFVSVDPTVDERVVFTITPTVGESDSFAYLEAENKMKGDFRFTEDNIKAVLEYRRMKKSGELEKFKVS